VIGRAIFGFLLVAFLFVPVERLVPIRRGQKVLRAGWRTDVVHFFLTGTLGTVATVVLAIPAVIWLGLITPDSLHDAVRSQPDVLQFLEALLIVEVVGYWAHRMMHTVPAFWKLHRVHHSSAQMDWLAAAHLHPLDQAITRLLAVIPLFVLGFSRETFGAAIVVLLFHAIAQHANVRVRLGPLRYVVSGPQNHHWHHTNDPEGRDTNFAGLFPWLDLLFGTYHVPKDTWPETYGIDEPMAPGYLGQLGSPFRRLTSERAQA
jgi:sterol desaturase/sphingolipid hydroxylase (fatty acid hydroxylase superfamily)